MGFDDEDGKYFEDLVKDLVGKHVSFEFLDLKEYGTLYWKMNVLKSRRDFDRHL